MSTIETEQLAPELRLITLNRPECLNAISWEMVDELHAVLDDLDDDNRTRVVVLTGAGRGFCAGLDLNDRTMEQSTAARGLRRTAARMRAQERISDVMVRLRKIPQPVIAAINGSAFGGGLALALFSDVRIAAESAQFCTQFINIGLSGCDVGVSYVLPRLIGASRAFELMLTGRTVDAQEAERVGLVARVVPDADVLDISLRTAEAILSLAPFGVAMTKQVMWANLAASSLDSALSIENRTQILATYSEDFREALESFAIGRGRER